MIENEIQPRKRKKGSPPTNSDAMNNIKNGYGLPGNNVCYLMVKCASGAVYILKIAYISFFI